MNFVILTEPGAADLKLNIEQPFPHSSGKGEQISNHHGVCFLIEVSTGCCREGEGDLGKASNSILSKFRELSTSE
jgi:hypothetical protein